MQFILPTLITFGLVGAYGWTGLSEYQRVGGFRGKIKAIVTGPEVRIKVVSEEPGQTGRHQIVTLCADQDQADSVSMEKINTAFRTGQSVQLIYRGGFEHCLQDVETVNTNAQGFETALQ